MKNPFNQYNLTAFKTIVEKGSFTAAARDLKCSQGQLSSIVMSIENYCQTSLFQRNAKGSTLTPQGKLLLSAINNYLIFRTEFMYEVDCLNKNKVNDSVTIYAPPGSINYLSNSLLPIVYARHPEITVTMKNLHSGDDENYDSILEKTDILISFSPSKIPSAINNKFKLSMGFYIAPCLFNASVLRSPQDLHNIPCITVENYGTKSNSWEYYNEQGGLTQIEINGKYSCHDITSAIPLAISGLGVIFIPTVAAVPHILNGELVELFPHLPTPIKSYYFIYTNLTKKKRNASIMLKELITHANELESKIQIPVLVDQYTPLAP